MKAQIIGPHDHFRCPRIAVLGIFILISSGFGCSLFLGNIRPVEEKSTQYGILDLTKMNPDWIKLDNIPPPTPERPASEIPDTTYQSKKTGSVISINSICKDFDAPSEANLKASTNALLLGISGVSIQEQKPIPLWNSTALQTTLKGKIDQQERILRTVVVHKDKCTYDLMYIAEPKFFNLNEADFTRFVTSLNLK